MAAQIFIIVSTAGVTDLSCPATDNVPNRLKAYTTLLQTKNSTSLHSESSLRYAPPKMGMGE